MAVIENWLLPVLHNVSRRAERHNSDKPLPINSGLLKIRLPLDIRDYLEIEAAKRGMTVAELSGKLLCVAAADRLVGAVLDDAVA